MSGQEYRFELKIAERHMPAISARLWLQRGVALGALAPSTGKPDRAIMAPLTGAPRDVAPETHKIRRL